jgi:hypothetical protein
MAVGAIGAREREGVDGMVFIMADDVYENGHGWQTEGLTTLEALDLILEIQAAIAYAEGR